MPRRKQDCPKRMKWELENAENAGGGPPGGGGGGEASSSGEGKRRKRKKPEGTKGGEDDNDNDNDNGDVIGSDSEDSSTNNEEEDEDQDVDEEPIATTTTSSRESSSSPPSPTRTTRRSSRSSSSSKKKTTTPAVTDILDFSKGGLPASQHLPQLLPPPASLRVSSTSPPSSAALISSSSPLSHVPTARKQSSQSRHSHPHPQRSRAEEGDSMISSSGSRGGGAGDSPLDLSVSHKKEDGSPLRKLPKWSPSIAEGVNHHPYIQHPQQHHGGGMRDRKNSWNGASPSAHSPDIKALEKMSEMTRVGGGSGQPDGKMTSPSGRGPSGSSSSWQAQWLAQNSSGNREVFKCVVCRATFNNLSALSVHMKESKHGPPMPNLPSPKQQLPPQQSPSQMSHPHLPCPPPSSQQAPSAPTVGSPSDLLLKETVQLPRKLVRGQDVWLGKGAEQTRQILKCMWCGQSFRSLAEMTQHMQQTQHYTNIISQEQLISWRSSEDKTSSPNSHVSAVLTCKVCDQAFSSLKELSNHMVKNSHYKEHIMRSITESGSRRRQSREKRKKSLPVRKLLELERANQEMKKEIRITCEKCSEKIPGPLFVEHLRVCGNLAEKLGAVSGGHISSGTSSGASSPLKQPTPSPKHESHHHHHHSSSHGHGHGGGHPASSSGRDSGSGSGSGELDLTIKEKGSGGGGGGDDKGGESSAINAIEKMIEKSFDYRAVSRNQGPSLGPSPPIIGTSILKRLGIDESVDYTKPLVDTSMLPLPPSGKYGMPPSSSSGRSRSRSVSSDKSEDLLLHTPVRNCNSKSNSNSNSNSSSPALPHDSDSNMMKSPLSLSMRPPSRKSPATESHKDSDIDDDNHSEASVEHHTSKTPSKTLNNNNNVTKRCGQTTNSLSALSSMFESIGGGGSVLGGGDLNGKNRTSSSPSSVGGGGGGFPTNSHHPLAALQKLCDKTENTQGGNNSNNGGGNSANSRPTSTSSSNSQSSPEPSSLLGLNWAAAAAAAAASEASDNGGSGGGGPIMATNNVLKCTFCDTPFLSKGAYRLHLAKMHNNSSNNKSPQDGNFHKESNSSNPPANNNTSASPSSANSTTNNESTINSSDSPASKLIKYAELAKQLSSK